MFSLREYLKEFSFKKRALGHFNAANNTQLKAIVSSAMENNAPVIIGVSEGERGFWGDKEIVSIIRTMRENYNFPIFLNADHTHSYKKIISAVEAGFDAVLFDGSNVEFEKNIEETKKVVKFVKEFNKKTGADILVEGEIGYIGSGSEILEYIPSGADISEDKITKTNEAKRFVEETGVDLLAPAVGNMHGMFNNAPNPSLYIDRLFAIAEAIKIPIVLHGGSGIRDGDFLDAINAGVRIVHISTELRRAWRDGIEKSLNENKNEIAPYKIAKPVIEDIKNAVDKRIKLFSK